jgi:hypothetical protein
MPKNVKQLQDELAAFVAAKDHEGVRRAYRGLLDLGQSRQEIMDEIICVSTSTCKLNEASPDHPHLTKSGKQEDELPSMTDRYLGHPVQVLRVSVDGSRHRPVEESDRGIVRPNYKLSGLRHSRFPHRLRNLTLIAAGIGFLSLGGLGFIHVPAPPPMATAPIAAPPPELTLIPGSIGPGWQVLDQIVGATAFNGTSNAFDAEETFASDRLLDHDKSSTEKPNIATLRHDQLGSGGRCRPRPSPTTLFWGQRPLAVETPRICGNADPDITHLHAR